MDVRGKQIIAGILFVAGLSALGWYINAYAPDTSFGFLVFYILIAFTGYMFFKSILNDHRRSCIYTAGVLLFFVLRSLNLKSFFYTILLIITTVGIDRAFQKVKK